MPGEPPARTLSACRLLSAVAVVLLAAACGGPVAPPPKLESLGENRQGHEELRRPGDGSVMVRIPAGRFAMGSEEGDDDERPVHIVQVGSFLLDKTEVTNRQYLRFCGETGRQPPRAPPFGGGGDHFAIRADHPVLRVGWEDARAYCSWVGGRLPTEAEWERAARSEDGRRWPWGDSRPEDERANFCDRNCSESWADRSVDDGHKYSAPVGSYPLGAGPYGVLDQAGNAREWCADWYGDRYYGRSASRNPTGAETGKSRVIRGGSWFAAAEELRATHRFRVVRDYLYFDIGFRCAMDAGQP
jgi:formylglycine-generating enzyme required for sulfatase activity